uniref:Uncharacterized protein LOC105060912 isoform X3 n=1 Tax=Elaeis guineensis var. tenera TaxID=51953 RepID=A0A6I9SNZ9_ELAGV|nr:uncharacterized protein LOC105060912 isoform X3 [Elaeis guineensis]XP_029116490.1 uncharacterized protein LOC105060912 isoform X3 [Elaeis guineensis]
MGYCASVQKNPDSAMGFRLGLGSQAKRFFIPSPAKEKPLNGQISVGGFDFKGKVVDSGAGLRSPEFGMKSPPMAPNLTVLLSSEDDNWGNFIIYSLGSHAPG